MIPTLAKPEEDDQLEMICLIISMTIIHQPDATCFMILTIVFSTSYATHFS